jgi:diguanylate cyclase (GGDEF)-like protein
MPLCARDHTLGVIELLNYRVSTLTDQTMAFLRVLCDFAAIAIQNVRAVERIQDLTITDDCTGLFNSRHLFSVTDSELERSRRFNLPFSLIFIDLDHFKRVNDLYGHLTGSRLLAEIARTIKNNVRGIDSAFRYGGDEFIVLLPQTGKDAALEVTQRLLLSLRETRYLLSDGLELQMMASFGVASYPEDGNSIQEIIGAADEMMYLVKNSSRGNIAVAQRGFVPER